MITNNCNTKNTPVENKPADWSLNELTRRAGALVREALSHYSVKERGMHWEDMEQTAVTTFLEHADKNAGYAYTAARTALYKQTIRIDISFGNSRIDTSHQIIKITPSGICICNCVRKCTAIAR